MMYLRSVLVFVCYILSVTRADFLVLTGHPEMLTDSISDREASEFSSRLTVWAYDHVTSAKVAQSELEEFAQTATYSIPPVVTAVPLQTEDTTVYITVPEWYSALPTAAKKFKDEEASAFVSAYDAVNGAPGARAGVDMTTTIAAIAAMTFSFVVVLL